MGLTTTHPKISCSYHRQNLGAGSPAPLSPIRLVRFRTSPSQGGVTGSIPVRVNMIESVTHLVTDFFIYITNLVKALRKGLIDAMMDLCK